MPRRRCASGHSTSITGPSSVGEAAAPTARSRCASQRRPALGGPHQWATSSEAGLNYAGPRAPSARPEEPRLVTMRWARDLRAVATVVKARRDHFNRPWRASSPADNSTPAVFDLRRRRRPTDGGRPAIRTPRAPSATIGKVWPTCDRSRRDVPMRVLVDGAAPAIDPLSRAQVNEPGKRAIRGEALIAQREAQSSLAIANPRSWRMFVHNSRNRRCRRRRHSQPASHRHCPRRDRLSATDGDERRRRFTASPGPKTTGRQQRARPHAETGGADRGQSNHGRLNPAFSTTGLTTAARRQRRARRRGWRQSSQTVTARIPAPPSRRHQGSRRRRRGCGAHQQLEPPSTLTRRSTRPDRARRAPVQRAAVQAAAPRRRDGS